MQNNVTVVGAGLAGTLAAIYLAKRDFSVALYEMRPDMREVRQGPGRSINLALSERGIHALTQAGIYDAIRPHVVPMRARAIYDEQGNISYQAFGRHKDEYIAAVSRELLNIQLLELAEKTFGIPVHFNHRVEGYNCETGELKLHNQAIGREQAIKTDVVIGADGVNSAIRQALSAAGHAQFEKTYLDHGYRELMIPAEFAQDLPKEHLHLWPRKSFMLLGNPNVDGSITLTLFLANEGSPSFAQLTDEAAVMDFFKTYFPNVVNRIPDLTQAFFTNPQGNLSSVAGGPWYYQDKVMLLGDASHGIVPFFGQGMNSAFEDCSVLDALLAEHGSDWQTIMPAFYQVRRDNTDAISAMAMDNYLEIRDHVSDPQFKLRREVEFELMARFPDQYISKHVMVMFSRVSYAFAKACGKLQQQLLGKICQGVSDISQINWAEVEQLLKNYDAEVLNQEKLMANQNL